MNKKLILFMTSLALAITPVSAMASEYTAPEVSIEAVEERATLKAATGSYRTWLQYDAQWRDLTLGYGGDTMADSGCLVTSIAILMVHSGATDENGVDPGKLCTYLTNNGGFTAYSELIWSKVNGAVEGFNLANWKIGLSGSRQDKVEQIRRYLNMGYYIVLNVGHGGHWVAVDYVDAAGNVYIFDPAYSVTCLFDFWSAEGVVSMATFTSTGKGNGSIDTGETEVTDYDATGKVNVGASYLNVRSGVGTNAPYLKDSSGNRVTLKNGEEVVITGKCKDSSGNIWYRVFIDGAVGYVYGAYVDILTAADMVTGEGKPATVTGSLVNIRKGAGQAYEVVGTAPRNAQIRVYESKKDSQGNLWYKVKYGNVIGYIIADYIQLDEEKEETSETIYSKEKSGKVNAALVNMRKAASYSASVLKELPLNTKVTVLGETKDSNGTKWYKVKYNSTKGYIVAEYITLTEDNTSSSDYAEYKNGVVNADYVSVRTGAGTNHSIKTSLMKNTPVTITGEAKDSSGAVWYKIKYSGGEGYMRHDFIDIKTDSGNNNNNNSTNDSYKEKTGKVNQNSVNVRKGAGTNYNVVATLAKGTEVKVVGEGKDSSGTLWYKIKFSGGEGYIRHDFITLDSSSSNNNNNNSNNNSNNGSYTQKEGKINGNGVNVRTGAGTSYSKVTSLSTGTVVTIIGEAKDTSGALWYKIKYSGGEGYVHSNYVTITTGSSSSTTPTPTPSYTSKNGVVNADYVSVRTGAGTSNSKKASLMKGTSVTIIGEEKDRDGDLWYKIQYSGGEGYIYSDYVDIVSGSSSSTTTDSVIGKEGVVTPDSARVRKAANSKAEIIDVLQKNTSVTILNTKKDSSGVLWYKISYSGKTGFMLAQYISVK